MKVNPQTASITHIYDGEEVVSVLTMDGADQVWLATFGCPLIAQLFVDKIKRYDVLRVPPPDSRGFVGKSKAIPTGGR